MRLIARTNTRCRPCAPCAACRQGRAGPGLLRLPGHTQWPPQACGGEGPQVGPAVCACPPWGEAALHHAHTRRCQPLCRPALPSQGWHWDGLPAARAWPLCMPMCTPSRPMKCTYRYIRMYAYKCTCIRMECMWMFRAAPGLDLPVPYLPVPYSQVHPSPLFAVPSPPSTPTPPPTRTLTLSVPLPLPPITPVTPVPLPLLPAQARLPGRPLAPEAVRPGDRDPLLPGRHPGHRGLPRLLRPAAAPAGRRDPPGGPHCRCWGPGVGTGTHLPCLPVSVWVKVKFR